MNTLKEISKYTEKNFLELVQTFITDLKEEDDVTLGKWNLSYKTIFNKNEDTVDNTLLSKDDNQEEIDDTTNSETDVKSVKLNIKTSEKSKKIKLTVKKSK